MASAKIQTSFGTGPMPRTSQIIPRVPTAPKLPAAKLTPATTLKVAKPAAARLLSFKQPVLDTI
jgi:hypothetical protein